MTIVQPGQVPTYSPSPAITLSSYDDSDRTRFLFNGSQFIKARLVSSRPSFAYVGVYPEVTSHTEYKTSDGKFVLVDGVKYVPVASGAPTYFTSQAVVVGFPVSVTTSEVVFWGTSFLDYYSSFKVEYSYDGSFYFDISGVSTVWEWDTTARLYEGEEPPTGQYKYTITLGSSYTAKYFRLSSYHTAVLDATFADGATTMTVESTSNFPDSWASSVGIRFTGLKDGGGTVARYITYTSKTDTTFVGVALSSAIGDDVVVDSSSVVEMIPGFALDVTEIDVLGTYDPIMEVWDTDGTQASSQSLSNTYYYDLCFDTHSDVYFGIRLNEDYDGTGGSGFSLSDNFTYSTSVLDTTRWTEHSVDANFQVNTASGTLDYTNSAAAGRVITNYYLDGDFTTDMHFYVSELEAINGVIQMRAVDTATNNVFVQVGQQGNYQGGDWEALQARNTINTTAGAAEVNNLRVDVGYLTASEVFTFVYDSTGDVWNVTTDLSTGYSDISPGVSYSEKSLALSIVHNSTPSNGAQIVYNVNHQTTSGSPGASDAWRRLGLEKGGGNIVCRYDNDMSGTFVDWVTYTDPDDLNLSVELYADGLTGFTSISLDNYTVSGTEYFSNVPVFSVEALDSSGSPVEVAGLTDSDGYLIKQFDIVNDTLTYNSFIGDRVQIATDSSSSGAVYIKVKENLYKYNKSSFPLDLEEGATAAVYKEGVIPETSAKAFSYNAYTKAGLCYVEYDGDRAGTYLKTISTTTMSGTEYEAFLDIGSADYPLGWDQNNNTILYYVDGTSLKEYDMDEYDVAFCNVVSDEKIMSAGTSTTSDITATVLNVYGEPLSSKTVAFVVSSGDGAISGSPDCTNSSGIAASTYTVGSTVGTTNITATASDVSC